MSKNKLFDEDSEEEVSFKTENEYAKKYDKWREKEELYKLEQKYGSKARSSDASSSSDSEDESDEPLEVPEEVETQFLKTLALLKTKDPRIYDPNFKCFDEKEEKKEENAPKSKTLTFEDDDEDSDNGNIFTVEKKAEIIPEKTEKTKSGKIGKEGKLKDYLTGKAEHIDQEVEQDLAPLKALWSDPALNEGEAFLRDYILNKKYLEEGTAGDAEDKIRDDEELEEDERRVEEQGQFERAYNFRFEEPDQEYLKRYPRTMNYTRPKDDSRSKKRAEIRARKEEEKRRKMEEIARMKALKLKEIQEKIAKIKEVTGNEELAFEEQDIEGDFDPEEHDKRMKALFDEQYCNGGDRGGSILLDHTSFYPTLNYYGEADDQKPVFPDLDEELEIENWEHFEPGQQDDGETGQNEDGPHCEDEDFNMDADYDPKQARANLLEEIQSTLGKKRRNRKKKSKLAELLTADKPKFVPAAAEKTYAEYMEEYYKMDCEDVIGGDLPTRFKYRQVVPNDFGLTIEEILLADDKELTQWVPLKKIVKHRPADVEKSEVNTYKLKAADERLKKKLLPSLFKDLPEEPELVVPVKEGTKKKKKKKKNKENKAEESAEQDNIEQVDENDPNDVGDKVENGDESETAEVQHKKKKKKNKKGNENIVEEQEVQAEETSLNLKVENTEASILKKKKHKKEKDVNEGDSSKDTETKVGVITAEESNLSNGENTEASKNKKKKKKHKSDGFVVEQVQNAEPSHVGHEGIKTDKQKGNLKRKLNTQGEIQSKKKKFDAKNNKNKQEFKTKFKQKNKFKSQKNKDNSTDNPLSKLSDERLKAYGLHPKKYRSFLKYKKF